MKITTFVGKRITLALHFCLLYLGPIYSYVKAKELPPYYYDNLRASTPVRNVTVVKGKSNGKVMHLVEDNGDQIRLCHIPIFFQYTGEKGNYNAEGNKEVINEDSCAASAGALFAAHHFNNGISTVVPQLKKTHETCNIRLTTEIFDTGYSYKKALDDLIDITSGREYDDIKKPKPFALLGSSRREVNEKMATITEQYDLLQVSPTITAYSDSDKFDFPLFARTNPTDFAWVNRLVEYLHDELDVRYLAILYDDTKEGEEFRKAIQEAKKEYGGDQTEHHKCGDKKPKINFQIEQTQVSLSENGWTDETKKRLEKNLEYKFTKKNTKYSQGFNYFVGYFKAEYFEQVMAVCKDVGVVGEKGLNGQPNVWFFRYVPDTINDASVAEAVNGSGIIHYEGGFDGNLFENQWNSMSETMLKYIHNKQPPSIRKTTNSIDLMRDAYFSYDAMIGIGLAACSQGKQNNTIYISGVEHHKNFVKNSFEGASGKVLIDQDNYARETDSVSFFVSNLRVFDGKVHLERTSYYNASESEFMAIDEFIYCDGGTTRPRDRPEVMENTNTMTWNVRAAGLAMCTISMTTSVGFIIFTFVKRKKKVIRMSQPPFLYMVAVGSLIMSSSIIPLSIDDGIAAGHHCTIACNAKFWLLCIGFTTMFSALFSKLWRIIKLISSAKKMKRVTIKAKDVMGPFIVLMGSNLIILILQAVLSPIKWVSDAKNICDSYNQLIESQSYCDYSEFLPYGVLLVIVNATALVAAIITAYKARNMSTELQESKYIAIAMLSTFETFLFLVPVAVLVGNLPTVSFFVYSAAIFVISMSVLLLIFVPKLFAMAHPSAPQHISSLMKTSHTKSQEL